MSTPGPIQAETAVVGAFVTEEPLDHARAVEAVQDERTGAVVSFSGVIRDHDGGRPVTSLDYTCHPGADRAVQDVARRVAEETVARAQAEAQQILAAARDDAVRRALEPARCVPGLRGRYPISRGTGCPGELPRPRLLLEFYLLPLPYTPLDLFSLFRERTSFNTTNCFLLFHAALLALGDEPAFAANSTKNATLDYFLAKALE